jgi:hypothetical protein
MASSGSVQLNKDSELFNLTLELRGLGLDFLANLSGKSPTVPVIIKFGIF